MKTLDKGRKRRGGGGVLFLLFCTVLADEGSVFGELAGLPFSVLHHAVGLTLGTFHAAVQGRTAASAGLLRIRSTNERLRVRSSGRLQSL